MKDEQTENMTSLDFEELVMFLLGIEDCDTESDLIEQFEAKYGVGWENGYKLVKDLLPLCMVAKGALSDKVYQGFATAGGWLCKRELVQSRVTQ